MNNPPYPIRQVTLIEQLETLKPHWDVYLCGVELIDGTIIENCSIESDPSGDNMAYDSLMDEAGNPISSWELNLSSSL